jgi:hypothetical protein
MEYLEGNRKVSNLIFFCNPSDSLDISAKLGKALSSRHKRKAEVLRTLKDTVSETFEIYKRKASVLKMFV